MTVFELVGMFYIIFAAFAFTAALAWFAYVGIQQTRKEIKHGQRSMLIGE